MGFIESYWNQRTSRREFVAGLGVIGICALIVGRKQIPGSHAAPPVTTGEVLVESIPKPQELSEEDFSQVFDKIFFDGSNNDNIAKTKSTSRTLGNSSSIMFYGEHNGSIILTRSSDYTRTITMSNTSLPTETEYAISNLKLTLKIGEVAHLNEKTITQEDIKVTDGAASGEDLFVIAGKLQRYFDIATKPGMPVGDATQFSKFL